MDICISKTFKITSSKRNWIFALNIADSCRKIRFMYVTFNKYTVPTGLYPYFYFAFYPYFVPTGQSQRD